MEILYHCLFTGHKWNYSISPYHSSQSHLLTLVHHSSRSTCHPLLLHAVCGNGPAPQLPEPAFSSLVPLHYDWEVCKRNLFQTLLSIIISTTVVQYMSTIVIQCVGRSWVWMCSMQVVCFEARQYLHTLRCCGDLHCYPTRWEWVTNPTMNDMHSLLHIIIIPRLWCWFAWAGTHVHCVTIWDAAVLSETECWSGEHCQWELLLPVLINSLAVF